MNYASPNGVVIALDKKTFETVVVAFEI